MLTVLAANSGKAFLQITTLENASHRVLVDQAPQTRRWRIAWTVEGHRFETGLGHDKHATTDARRESQSGQPIPGSLTPPTENGTREQCTSVYLMSIE